MSKIYCNLPIFAIAKFSIEKPDNWDDMFKAEQEIYFVESTTLKSETSLCRQCVHSGIETDFEVDLDAIDENQSLDFY